MKNILFILLAAAVTLVSCRKVIDLDLKETDPQFVLKGEVNAGDSVHTLNITKYSRSTSKIQAQIKQIAKELNIQLIYTEVENF